MKKISLLLLACSAFLLTGCIDFLEEIRLNKDGSGRYKLTMDMSEFFSDPFMKGLFEETLKSDTTLKLANAGELEVDSILTFEKAAVDKNLGRPEFWKNVKMHLVMSESREKMVTTMEFEFKDVSDIDYFYKNLEKVQENDQAGMLGGGMMPMGALFTFTKKSLQRMPATQKPEAMGEEELGMAKMFFASASYKTVYTLPGKVKKVSIAGAEINGNSVVVNTPLMDMIEGKARVDGEIRFKN